MIIEIWTKDKYSKNEEAGLISKLAAAGLKTSEVKTSRLYKIDAPWPKAEFERLAGELLTDKITEMCTLNKRPSPKGFYRAEVWLKTTATDVVGESVKEAIHDLLGRAPESVRFGKAYYVKAVSEAALRSVVLKTLMNEVVNICEIQKL